MTMPNPQETIFAVVHEVKGESVPTTASASGRWAFKSFDAAAQRAHYDRQSGNLFKPPKVRVARYKFDGWAT